MTRCVSSSLFDFLHTFEFPARIIIRKGERKKRGKSLWLSELSLVIRIDKVYSVHIVSQRWLKFKKKEEEERRREKEKQIGA